MSEWSNLYEYTPTNVRLYVSETLGLYRLIYYSEDKYCVFYIGHSNNLKEGLLEHLRTSDPDSCIRNHIKGHTCYFRYLQVSAQAELKMIERQQIVQYNPDCNPRW